ncbi:unnamed protein product [Linum tenue]|uniref:Uncharacterized protein n=1 Tax=Linum tenue TaxID=586396 RepID=A0AAV0RP48_9ROSI|nr:unnamed protein product [Linum tenue]
MALTSSTLQTIFSSPSVASRARTTSYSFPRIASVPRLSRNAVLCMATGQDEKTGQTNEPAAAAPPTTSQIPAIPPPPPKPKVSTKFGDVLAFSGPAPERINGRLAMVGFVAALAVELSKGQDVFTQISEGGTTWFVATSVVFTLASLIPLFKGITVESKSGGLMTSDAEMWNGRFAMLGLVALAFTEYVKGGPFV